MPFPPNPQLFDVVLSHGLFMGRPVMWPLARRLAALGFTVRCFGYGTVWPRLQDSAMRLAQHVQQGSRPVVLVGHSLGGLVSLSAHAHLPAGMVQGCVLLAAPVRGPRAATVLRRWTGGKRSPVARALHDWADLAERPQPPVPTLVIAGTLPIGMSRWLCRFEEPNDGTVTVAETEVPGAETCVLRVSHSGMLFDPQVAERVGDWLLALSSRLAAERVAQAWAGGRAERR